MDGRVRYARNGQTRLAYREFGESDTSLVWIPGWFSNVEQYDDPMSPFTAVVEQLTTVCKVVVWDKRGTGLSDPATQVPSLDERMDDLHAVLDAAGVERPTLFGMSEGGPMSLLFAATFPERVRSLVMYGVAARFSQELPDHPWGFTAEQKAGHLANIESHWGEGALAELFFGEIADVPGFRDFYGRYQRTSASPTMAAWLWQALLEIDVRGILTSIHTPALVLARPDDQVAPFEAAAALAAAMPAARFAALPAGPHSLIDDVLGSAIRDFVAETPGIHAVDERVLATVLFTDIVGSTEQLSSVGDSTWRQQLDTHDKVVDWLLEKYGGRRVKHTGDGIFALFDGPTKAARCALDLIPALGARGLRIRAGVHIGECERRGDEWSGVAVHIGARVGALAGPDEVLTSRTVRDLSAGSGLQFESRGERSLKGLPEEMEIFRVTTGR
ncbi:MAG: adenylate/guanylate cyclase domain-containing protein [Mycobacterium sp.]